MSKYKLLFIEDGEYIKTRYTTKEHLEELFSKDNGWCFWKNNELIMFKENRIRFEIVEVPDE